MRVVGLDGRRYVLSLKGHGPSADPSALHLRARLLLAKLYPLDPRLEEVPLPGTGGLTADFFLPLRKLVVETHGRQHYEYVNFFHRSRLGFAQSRERDGRKAAWCELNGFTYVELPYDEDDGAWEGRIRTARG